MTNTRNTPTEALERAFPLRVRRYRLRRAAAAPGRRGENWLVPGGNESRAERLADKITVRLRAGDVLRMLTPGGGGRGEKSSQ